MPETVALDRTDVRLVRLLQKNARLTNKELAAKVGVAPSTALERVRRLRAAKVLRGFHADVSLPAVGVSVEALVAVQLVRHSREAVEAFLDHLRATPEVVGFFHLAGADDFLVHVGVRDAAHLRELAMTAFTERPEVARIQTSLVYAAHRSDAPPLYTGADAEGG